jgi:alpha-pyrone synthase
MKSYINAIGTAVPQYKSKQLDIADFMSKAHRFEGPEEKKLFALYKSTRIETRHSVIEDYGYKTVNSFFPNRPTLEQFPTTSDRMAVYQREALSLSKVAIKKCFDQQRNFDKNDVTHLITISCTGMYAPGLDIELIRDLGLSPTVKRTAINFMGCYAAFNGLKMADTICRADGDAKVLMVAVELCTLHFQKEYTDDNLFANALFADGAAAVLVEGAPKMGTSLEMENFVCTLDPDSSDDMAWKIGDFGFEMRLSSYVPAVIKNGIKNLTSNLLADLNREHLDVSYYAIHPGGKKIVDVIEEELGLTPNDTRFSREILKNYGNMSSPTVLFVLNLIREQLSEKDNGKHIMSFAFGPGLTLESALLKIQIQ